MWYVWGSILFFAVHRTSQQTIKAPTLPVSPSCAGTLKPILIMYNEMKLATAGTSPQTFTEQTLGACGQICVSNKGPGGDINCAGFEYNAATKTCTVYAAFDPSTLTGDPATGFYQKSCIDTTQGCQSPFQFEAIPQKILVGFARLVVPATTPNDCVKQCLESYTNHGFECQSSMYYPVDQECILNVESRYKRPDLFNDENTDQVIYFDNNCAGASCYSPFTTGYTKTSDITLNGIQGVTVAAKSLQACEWLCTHRIADASGEQYNCKSFLYRASDQTCIMNDDRLQPLGRASSGPTPGTDYYEKGCYASRATCRNPPAFTRFPQMILVGFAAYVVENVPSVTQCLDLCLSPPAETGGASFKCMSVMYYYNEQECILNTDSKTTRPDVFVPEGTGLQVDYFDIMCLLAPEMCPSGTMTTAIRIPNSQIQPNSNITLKDGQAGTPLECRDACYKLAPEKCRSYNYNTGASQCTLLLINSDSAFPAPASGTDVYDLLCIPGEVCAQAAAFDRTPLKGNPSTATKSLDAPTALPDCLAACIKETCAGVNYNVFSGKCDLYSVISRRRRQTNGGASAGPGVQQANLVDNPSVDWYQNNCAGGPSGVETICTFDGMKVIVTTSNAITGAVFAKMKYDTCRVEVKEARMAMLTLGFPVDQTIIGCGDDGAGGCGSRGGGYGGGGQPGAYAGRYKRQGYGQGQSQGQGYNGGGGYGGGGGGGGGCRGNSCGGGALGPPALPAPKDCGVIDLQNGTYKATIVVQSNNLGIPGLVTSMDQIYDVSCDYSGVQAKKIQTNATLHVEGPTPALIQPRGKIQIGSPVSMQLMGGGGFAALAAKLGDVLELHWEMMALDDDMDFFVQRCVAEPGTVQVPVGKPGGGGGGGGYGGAGTSCSGGDCQLSGGIPRGIADIATAGNPPGARGSCIGGECQLSGGPPAPAQGQNCVGGACSLNGGPPGGGWEQQLQQQQLLLIDKGCPTPGGGAKVMPGPIVRVDNKTKTAPLQAFRFDGSRSIRIICQIDICIGQCNPTTCTIGGQPQTSFGRKKRQHGFLNNRPPPTKGHSRDVDEDENNYETGEYRIPKRAHTMTSIVILDPADENVNQAATENKQRAAAQRTADRRYYDSSGIRISSPKAEKVCMPKSMFLGAFLFLTCLAFAQAIAVGIILSRQCFSKKIS